ncbi:hypothetical protein N7517_000231 [Penicillium concentricum]|uniref:Uncharacterized protein n=1 Tax=Penicillium concentricum TaxID=293559 RepID=A0A9W9SQL4_9EURO|nr:uncharacterized protein N7517_000231 [Penicillium concentricum]KAJ5382320.1 hypothetical protein N7517_000231 [Penicillium concentricum]
MCFVWLKMRNKPTSAYWYAATSAERFPFCPARKSGWKTDVQDLPYHAACDDLNSVMPGC